MAYQLSTLSTQRRSRGQVIAERLDLHTALVSLGAGALGATVLAFVSGGLALAPGGLVAQNHETLILAAAIGLIEAVLTALFKTGAFEMSHDEPTPLPLYLENIRLTGRPAPAVRTHFRTEETTLLRQVARERSAR